MAATKIPVMTLAAGLLAAACLGTEGAAPASSENDWEVVFSDPGAGDWQEHWFVEGEKATVEYNVE